MPCDYRILQSPTKEQVKLVILETVQRSLLSGASWHIKQVGCIKEKSLIQPILFFGLQSFTAYSSSLHARVVP